MNEFVDYVLDFYGVAGIYPVGESSKFKDNSSISFKGNVYHVEVA